MRSFTALFVFLAVLVLIDIYSFKGMRTLISPWPPKLKLALTIFYWLAPVILLGTMAYMFMHRSEMNTESGMQMLMFFMGLFVLVYVPKIVFTVFHLLNDAVKLLANLVSNTLPLNPAGKQAAHTISRNKFLTYLGAAVAAVPFAGILHGIIKGRFDYRVKKQILTFDHLPKAFDGLRVVQISDSHVGSFINNMGEVNGAMDLINAQNPDLLLFTGDMVNNRSTEASKWVKTFSKLNANVTKLAILGNHDYGDYADWPDEAAKKADIQNLIRLEEEMGFKVLLNDAVRLRRNNEEIAIIGVENWGHKPFPQYGNLDKAIQNVKDIPFKMLLSHDPSHWDAKVLGKTDIAITYSGHTHGMQFGLNLPGFKWSPVKYRYPRWAGLYQEGKQYLYVNRGFGYIAFPGRVGMPPEITVTELKQA